MAADIIETQERLRVVSGQLDAPACKDCEVIVVVMGDEQGHEIHNYRVFERPGKFRLAALHDSRFLVAFQDLNRDFAYQSNEPAVWFDLSGSQIKRGDVADVVLSLGGPSARPLPAALERLFDLRGNSLGKIDVQLGKVVSLDDERFGRESASMSMWEPIGFMKAGRAGIFFLEPYDPAKTPVLFVHGINGTGRNFASMIEHLDRQRFQPWVLNYPSGMDLRALGDGLVGLLAELRHRYGFSRMHFVAHSMGGLMVREYLAECVRTKSCDYAGNFVSISSPYGGVANMDLWLDFARVVMPAWRNLVADGPFLKNLFALPLPSGVRHTMLISYRNTSSFSRESGDGVILLKSQFRLDAQRQAVAIRGFDEDHVSILQSADVHTEVNLALLANGGR
ncbi:MAG: alpha/beta fold hydrolase [Dechloromonas sp.]|nr:alpha/beta fold hydrolase [Dechloromonas sp.]